MTIEESKELIINALNDVPQDFYRLKTTYSDGIVRERIFCYEFYHRMRLIQEHDNKNTEDFLCIHGEIDKSGHILFDKDDRKNPDFVFHIPGAIEGNQIVIEVKGKLEGVYKDQTLGDFDKLLRFTKPEYCYQLGIFIAFNYDMNQFIKHMKEALRFHILDSDLDSTINRILIICKRSSLHRCECETLENVLYK